MVFKFKVEDNTLMLITDDKEKIIIPESKLEDATNIYKEIFPFVDFSFEHYYGLMKQDQELQVELRMDNDFAKIFTDLLKEKFEWEVLSNV